MRCASLEVELWTQRAEGPRLAPRLRGVTMVEVLVALALLGGLVAAGVTAQGRLVRDAAADAARIRAVEAADALLARWWVLDDLPSHPRLPRHGSGEIPGDPELRWTMRMQPMAMTSEGVRAVGGNRRGLRALDRLELSVWQVDSPTRTLYQVDLLLPAVGSAGPRRGVGDTGEVPGG